MAGADTTQILYVRVEAIDKINENVTEKQAFQTDRDNE